jgi:hypothetical protein
MPFREVMDRIPFGKQQRIANPNDRIGLVLPRLRERGIEVANLPDSQPHEFQAKSIRGCYDLSVLCSGVIQRVSLMTRRPRTGRPASRTNDPPLPR